MAKIEKSRPHTEAKGLILLGSSAILLLSLLSFHVENSHQNWLGLFGWSIGCGL